MPNPLFATRDHRIIHITPGGIRSDNLAGNLQTVRVSIGTARNTFIATDLTPRETIILANLLLEAYRKTLPREEDHRNISSSNKEGQ